MSSSMHPSSQRLAQLLSQLDAVFPASRRELRARIGGLEKRLRDGGELDPRALLAVEKSIQSSIDERARRRSLVPVITYPPALPVTHALDALRTALNSAQVVVVAGETGSGKSTQLPKLCLEIGRGVDGCIAHTQPRRIAARSVARRIAEELDLPLGGVIGVKVRFGDDTSRDTLVKVMTDGILLAQTRSDPRLDAYDTVIIDEAHERTLNIDFLLGYLRRLLPRRPNLKLILTSATIDVERLSAHFGHCPIVEIPGRAHPIEIRYAPPPMEDLDEEDPQMLECIGRAIDEIDDAMAPTVVPDILVFLSGEREIREVETFLAGKFRGAKRATEIVPLFARQGLDEQERIFKPGVARRIVLATNVAETSLTVPRIHAVIDLGFARVLRYSAKSRVQRLPVEEISQASARQRAGRAGRLGPGMAVRLYSQENHDARAPFTQPEILRSNLASVILQMDALSLGRAEDFPFVDAPSARLLADGRATLVELGASTVEGKLTEVGRSMSQLPLDPRLARMLLASIEQRCSSSSLVLAAGLAVQDPRLRPAEKRDAADMAHARFRDGFSDFASFLRLWQTWRNETAELGSSARRSWCEKNYLSHQRMREWSDTWMQLRELFLEHLGVRCGEPPEETETGAFHRAILAGFATQIGVRNEKGEYRSPNGALFALHPSGTLARRAPNWVVAFEIVETHRRLARVCARIQPEWIVRVAPHLCSRSQFEPHFVEESGQVAAWERTSFGELVVIAKKRVPYGPVDPVSAREVFIQEALVAGRVRTQSAFFTHNQELRAALQREEERSRRRGLLLEDEAAYAFYDARVPAEIHSTPSLESWMRQGNDRDGDRLRMIDDDLVRDGAERVSEREFPAYLQVDALSVPLEYTHEPERAEDGVTARIPVEALSVLDPEPFEWTVPGLLSEKVEALVRSLPKPLRVRLFPINEVVAGAVEALEFGRGSLLNMLARHLTRLAHCPITAKDFRLETIPRHLLMRFCVIDADGSELGAGRDLAQLATRFAAVARDRLRGAIDRNNDAIALLERESVTQMSDDEIPLELAYQRAGIRMVGFPALILEGTGNAVGVALRVFDVHALADEAHRAAVGVFVAQEMRDAIHHHVAYDPLCEEFLTRLAYWCGDDTDGTMVIARLVAAQGVAEAPRPPRSMSEFLAVVRALEPSVQTRVSIALRTLHAILGEADEVLLQVRNFTERVNSVTINVAGYKSKVTKSPARASNAASTPLSLAGERIAARLNMIVPRATVREIAACDRDELAQRLRLTAMLRARAQQVFLNGPAQDAVIHEELARLQARVDAAVGHRTRTLELRRATRRMLEEIEISRFAPKIPRQFAASVRRLDHLLGGVLGEANE